MIVTEGQSILLPSSFESDQILPYVPTTALFSMFTSGKVQSHAGKRPSSLTSKLRSKKLTSFFSKKEPHEAVKPICTQSVIVDQPQSLKVSESCVSASVIFNILTNSSGKQPKHVPGKLERGSSSLYAEGQSSSLMSAPSPLTSIGEEQSFTTPIAKRSKLSVTTTPNTSHCQTSSSVSISTLFNLFANSSESFRKDTCIKTQSGASNSLEMYCQPLKSSVLFDNDMQEKVDEHDNLETQEDMIAISLRKDTTIGTASVPMSPIVTSTTPAQSVSSDSADDLDVSDLTYFHEGGYSPDPLPDESSNEHSLSSDSEDEKSDYVKVYSHPEYSHPLPFPSVSNEWYEKQRALEVHNAAREERRSTNTTAFDEEGNISFVDRSQTKGPLHQNIQSLKDQAAKLKEGSAKQHISSLIKAGEFIVANGPVVKTQEVGRIYLNEKGLTTRKRSLELYEVLSKHLNLAQIYMYGVAYVVHNTTDLAAITTSLRSTIDTEHVVKKKVQDCLKEVFPSALKYLDSHQDRQVLKALFVELTNISFAARLQGVKSRKGTRNATKSVQSQLLHYDFIRATSQLVRNDMTTIKQYQLTQRIISARKLKEIRTISQGRGRKLKANEFPELATVLSYAFGELEGGLEAHPRLTTGTVYRASDNTMTMRKAREVLLSAAPEGFTISLSSCFNYTQNFRKGSIQSKQHHAGKNVNADLSLKKPPRTGVQQLVVNLHWLTANVNTIVDSCQGTSHSLVVSKDAKSIVPTDIAPVQHPGPSWKKRELPDHSWDQSRINAITPMTFLFLQTRVEQLPTTTLNTLDLQVSESTILHLTRTGQTVTLLSLSFYEPDTTFKCLNEICYLLSLPELDTFFRDSATNNLKKEFVFVVDNGPAEQPSSSLVQMCLVRLLNFLKLQKITQVSFAEYHSKRNYVERAHAKENRVLSKHGPFSSKPIHEHAIPGSSEHQQNMECVAEEMKACIKEGSFGGRSLMCFRGAPQEKWVFSDEKEVQAFLAMNEEAKLTYSPSTYSVVQGSTLETICFYWNLDRHFEGQYMTDYKHINNQLLLDGKRSSWLDKYTTSLYSISDTECKRYELQPVPDFLRWFKTGELHYLPLEERKLLKEGPWDNIPEAYLPSRVLDLCSSLILDLPDELITQQISLLSWVTPYEVREYYKNQSNQYEQQIESEREKDRLKSHDLYKSNTKPELEKICRKLRIPVTSTLLKHQLVSLIIKNKGEQMPADNYKPYSGKLEEIPISLSKINNSLTIPRLRLILKFHGLPITGTKDQLVMRVYLLRCNKTAAVSAKEEQQLQDLISMIYKMILEQRRLSVTSHIYRVRKYSLQRKCPHFVPKPSHINSEEDLQNLFEPLLAYILTHKKKREQHDQSSAFRSHVSSTFITPDVEVLKNCVTQTGSKIKVRWTKEETQSMGWRAGWYVATVHNYCMDTDIITLTYQSEPNDPYDEELTPLIDDGKIKLIWSPL